MLPRLAFLSLILGMITVPSVVYSQQIPSLDSVAVHGKLQPVQAPQQKFAEPVQKFAAPVQKFSSPVQKSNVVAARRSVLFGGRAARVERRASRRTASGSCI